MTLHLNALGRNEHELTIGDLTILFSYEEPVAFARHQIYTRTSHTFSKTTAGHLSTWCPPDATTVLDHASFRTALDAALQLVR
jgi:hypothetical protein